MLWENYGDASPLEHGGIWVNVIRSGENTELRIVKNVNLEDGKIAVYDLIVDLSDSWLELDEVMDYIGMDEDNYDMIDLSIGCTDYYNPENFGDSGTIFDNENIEDNYAELQEYLEERGIEV